MCLAGVPGRQRAMTASVHSVFGGQSEHDDLVLGVALAAWWAEPLTAAATGSRTGCPWRPNGAKSAVSIPKEAPQVDTRVPPYSAPRLRVQRLRKPNGLSRWDRV